MDKLGEFELNKIYCMDCLEGLKKIPDKSVDLIVTDPPYFNIMKTDWKGNKHTWDNQWETFSHYMYWIGEIGKEIKRVLKLNGSFYMFADDKNCAYVQVELDKLFNLENSITWVKPNNMTIKGWNIYRSYANITEKILFYSNKWDVNSLGEIKKDSQLFNNLRQYCRDIRKYINYSRAKMFKLLGNGRSQHFLEPDGPQWDICTKETYQDLIEKCKINLMQEFREYEDLRKEYEDLRRYFNPDSNFTDVWTFNIMGGKESLGKHPTQKPLKIIERIIKTSSKEAMTVLDPFMGSGTTALACKQLNRKFIGFEISPEYCKIANERLKQEVLA